MKNQDSIITSGSHSAPEEKCYFPRPTAKNDEAPADERRHLLALSAGIFPNGMTTLSGFLARVHRSKFLRLR